VVVSLVAIVALIGYSSAQIMSSGVALESILDINYTLGAVLTTILIALYCFSGGIRASIWTDALQALVMIIAMMILYMTSVSEAGGFSQWISSLASVSKNYLSLYPSEIQEGQIWFLALIIMGWFAGGMGVAGQPHVMVRFMTLKDVKLINRARLYYYVYYILLYSLAIGIGLSARVLLPSLPVEKYEMALPILSRLILPDALVGVILAGLFASTMSTADSLIISSSATLTRDLFPKLKGSYAGAKIATLSFSGFALLLAVFSKATVFQLVIIFGGLLSACFAPVLILKSLKVQLKPKAIIIMIVSSAISTTLWRELGLSYLIYEVAIGMGMGLLMGFILKDHSQKS
jgi:Na+/proline symporter